MRRKLRLVGMVLALLRSFFLALAIVISGLGAPLFAEAAEHAGHTHAMMPSAAAEPRAGSEAPVPALGPVRAHLNAPALLTLAPHVEVDVMGTAVPCCCVSGFACAMAALVPDHQAPAPATSAIAAWPAEWTAPPGIPTAALIEPPRSIA